MRKSELRMWKEYSNWQNKYIASHRVGKTLRITQKEFIATLSEIKESRSIHDVKGSDLQITKDWFKQKVWQRENASKIREGMEVNKLEFINANIENIKEFRQEQMYQMDMKTFRAASEARKVLQGKGFGWSARSKSTQELAELMSEDIYEMKHKLEEQNKSTKEINLAISQFFFGS